MFQRETANQQAFSSIHQKIIDIMRWGQPLSPVRQAYHFLMRRVPSYSMSGDVPQVAVDAMQRVLNVLRAFAALPDDAKDALADWINHPLHGKIPGYNDRQMHGQVMARIYASHPDLLQLKTDMDAEEVRQAERLRQEAADREASQAAAEQRRSDAPSLVIAMHQAGLSLGLDDDGRAVVFPASLMTDEQRSFLATHGREMADAIRAERVSAG